MRFFAGHPAEPVTGTRKTSSAMAEIKSQEMPHSTKKELILGVMVGTAGISLLALWYHKIRKTRITTNLPKFLSLGKKFNSLTLQDETHSEQGALAVFQRRQLQILEKVNELLTSMEELKEEIKFLKETIPKLEEYLQDELGGKVTVHKISPQHRARKKRPTTAPSAATNNNSSEEAESEGGYITANTDTEEQSFPVAKAFNTHIEELKLDVLLQKVDRLRITEANKVESFELLCDHKEKFSEEIEFLWRLARAYGDMYKLSTNTQEKKHYANIGKTLGERAITRAPMNGHCHLCFLLIQAEELQPGYSVSNYMFVAKCYVDLEESQDAWKFCNLALLLPIVTKEDKESHKEVKKIICSLKRRKVHRKSRDNTENVKSTNEASYKD
ncbi:regulator of microtubule dynamics protein 2 isoform X3 [Microtus oregoni]|uniref:regulator of microtubule dynamics protein 2 isoform X3 n=1 Tax=Microtus oregoni TaxID=111838 RepID=UPI001BB20FA1|nr:regulator of microtubule dynamics protein 2 isoform X3 [Microtus oregoni]